MFTPLTFPNKKAGLGTVGDLPVPMEIMEFLSHVKHQLKAQCVRYTNPIKQYVARIAIAGEPEFRC